MKITGVLCPNLSICIVCEVALYLTFAIPQCFTYVDSLWEGNTVDTHFELDLLLNLCVCVRIEVDKY